MEKHIKFHELGLDDRILKAISGLGWKHPTLIQEKAIGLILEGKDIFAKARTGSGKTGAYIIPIIQNLLILKKTSHQQKIYAFVLAPTKELCKQICRDFNQLSSCCLSEINCMDIAFFNEEGQKSILSNSPDVLIGTPSCIVKQIKKQNVGILDSLKMLVIDEADLMFSFGYEEETKVIINQINKSVQCVMMSATLNENTVILKKLILHQPVVLHLQEAALPPVNQLLHYFIKLEEEEKFIVLCSLLKLKLIQGKTLLFVRSVDRCYKIRLFLEQFGIPCCVCHGELPSFSRFHIVEQFNQGLCNLLVASDDLDQPKDPKFIPNKSRHCDKESGISRGIDFQFVTNIINFDFPKEINAYIHRAGRTARGNNQGIVLSFVHIRELESFETVELGLRDLYDQLNIPVFQPYKFQMDQVESFRYRARDANRAVTRIAIREARIKEIQKELLASKKLKIHFEDHPEDLTALRHDVQLHSLPQMSHLKNVPEYLIPNSLKNLKGCRVKGNPKRVRKNKMTQSQKNFLKKQSNPLCSLKFN